MVSHVQTAVIITVSRHALLLGEAPQQYICPTANKRSQGATVPYLTICYGSVGLRSCEFFKNYVRICVRLNSRMMAPATIR